ncbi:centromere protein Q [Limanda limanda]|uniref:centromere protein Q n=1 Tax=Limanda limanda TaxID=27771 RepID=UPI0029C75A66|nr:centromere protein Q [Limanda limanda]
MKPVRGSSRPPSKAPGVKVKRKTTEETRKQQTAQQQDRRAAQKRKAEDSSSNAKKVKGQNNWKQLPQSTIVSLENIMDLSLLAVLALKRKDKKESQEHLNLIKTRFLAQCAQLTAPVHKHKDLKSSHHHHQEETKRAVAGKSSLSRVEEDFRAVVQALENAEEQTVSLQQTCRALRDKVEEEEEKAKEILQISRQAVLNLPPHLPQKDKTSSETMKKIIADSESEATARRLGEILQKSKAVQNAQVLLLHAHKHADRLLRSGCSTGSGSPGSEGT